VARECFDIVIAHSKDAAHVARATAYLQAIAQAAPSPKKEE
jgi:hypothetical protein